MKTHSATEPGSPRGPAPGPGFLPRAAWVIAAFAALFFAGGVRAQSFIPVISQVIATGDNDVYFDHDGDTPAVIILKNNGSVAGNLSGWGLTDNPASPLKWVFPSGAVPLLLAAGETLTVFASAKNRLTPPYATNFLLPCQSTAYLYNPSAALISQKTVFGSECPECLPFFPVNATSAWLVPTGSNPPSTGEDWRLPAFSDASWSRGQPCLGYESDPLLANMILYASFDTPDVNTATRVITDISGPTLHNGTWPASVFAPNISIPVTSPAVVNQSVGFAGPNNTDSFTSYAHHAELNPGNGSYTFSVWVHPLNTDPTVNEVLFRKGGTSTTDPGYVLTRQQRNGARFRIQTSTTAIDVGFTNVLAANAWTHIMVVIERVTGSTPVHQARIYRNGTQMSLVNFAAATSIASPGAALVQAQGAGASLAMFQGFQDDFVIWGRALTNAEVTRVFQAGVDGKKVNDPSVPGGPGVIFAPCIQTNVQTAMKGINPGLYERIRFTVPNADLVNSVTFRVKYADGFIAYINGVEIARRNALTGAVWNSAATANRPDASAIIEEEIPVPAAGINALVTGTGNVLAIHAMNATVDESRFLICPELCYDELSPGDCYVTTNGRNFWITFPGNAPDDSGNPLRLSVCITGSSGTAGNVSIPGLAFSQNFVLPAGGKTEISLPKTATLDTSDTVENKGVHIIASKNVAVYGKTRIDYSTDTFLAHPYKVLGSNYIVVGYQNSWIGYPDLNGSQFGIVATADNTHVTVKPKVATGSHAAGVAYNFILNQGQTYLLRNSNDAPADLTGTEITSDSPVAVFGGHRCANITGSLFFCDTVLEQTLPVALWNTEYCVAPLMTRTANELVRVVAAENGTTISINGVAQAPVLNKGDKRNFSVSGGAAFSANNRFLAAHMSRSSDADGVIQSDPFQLNAQPTASWLSGYKFCTAPATEFGTNYCNVFARNAELPGVTISPAPLLAGPVIAIAGTPYSYRQVTLAAGTTYITSGRTHGLEIYGWGEYDSYGHSGGMGFADTMPPAFVQCPPDITIFTTLVPGAGELATLPDLGAQFGVTDNCCPESSIVVVQTPGPGARLTAGDYQVVLTATDCGGNTVTCVVAVHVRTDPRATAFPTAFGNPALEETVWGWHANPDGDMLNNEQEYALGTDMAIAAPLDAAFTFREVTHNGQQGVEVSYRRRNDDPSLDYIPEGTADLNGWFSGLGHFEQTAATPDSLPGFTRIRAFSHDSVPFRHFFVRLNIRRN